MELMKRRNESFTFNVMPGTSTFTATVFGMLSYYQEV